MSSSKVKKQLKELLKTPGNRICADCPIKGPTWASINIGVFLCLQCAGIHRDIGVHITKVRSAELDTWQQEWVDVMAKWGNIRANRFWEANCPTDYQGRPTYNEAQELTLKLKRFIRDKYERKLWIPKEGDQTNDSHDATGGSESDSSSSSEESRKEKERRERRRADRMKKKEESTTNSKLRVAINTTNTTQASKNTEVDLLAFDTQPSGTQTTQATTNPPSVNAMEGLSSQFAQLGGVTNAQSVQQPAPAPRPVQQAAPQQTAQQFASQVAQPQATTSQQKIANIMSMYKQSTAQMQPNMGYGLQQGNNFSAQNSGMMQQQSHSQQQPAGIQQQPMGIHQQQPMGVQLQQPMGVQQQQLMGLQQQPPMGMQQQQPMGVQQQQPMGVQQQQPMGMQQQQPMGTQQQQPMGMQQQWPMGTQQQQPMGMQQQHQQPMGTMHQQHMGMMHQQPMGMHQQQPMGMQQHQPMGMQQQQPMGYQQQANNQQSSHGQQQNTDPFSFF